MAKLDFKAKKDLFTSKLKVDYSDIDKGVVEYTVSKEMVDTLKKSFKDSQQELSNAMMKELREEVDFKGKDLNVDDLIASYINEFDIKKVNEIQQNINDKQKIERTIYDLIPNVIKYDDLIEEFKVFGDFSEELINSFVKDVYKEIIDTINKLGVDLTP